MAEAIAFSLFSGGVGTAATFAATTAGQLAITAVSLGLSVATSAIVSALTPLPPSPKQSILVNARDPAAPQEFVYGETRKGGVTTYYETTRKGSVLYQIIAVAAHEVESIDTIYVNDKAVTLSSDGYDNGSRSGAGWVTDEEWTDDDTEHEIRIFYHTGNQTTKFSTFANSGVESLDTVFFNTGSADEDSQNFGGVGQPTRESFIGNGIAYIFVRYAFNSSVFSKGLPLITCKLKGKKVYDPRTTTTVYSNNAALCIRDYITSAYGLNDSEVDDTVFTVAANICDENVTLDAGGTEKRYTLNGVVRSDQSYGDVLQQMITSCSGTLFWGGGKWKLTVGAYSAPTKVLTLDDVRSNISVQTRTNLRDQFNSVQGVFTDSTNRYLVADYPPITSATFLAQDNGVEQALDLDLPFTTSSPMAQRLAKMTLFRGREQQVLSADFGLNAFDVEVGEIVALTFDRYGWDEKEFEVIGWNFNSSSEGGDLRVSLTLRETSSAAFSWTAEEEEIINNDSDLFTSLEPVANLTTQYDGTVSKDGTFLNGIIVDWDSVLGAAGYELEWTVNTSIDFAASGGIVDEADAVTTREQFIYKAYVEILYRSPDGDGFDFYNTGGGSSLTEVEVRAQLRASPEKASLKFAGITVPSPTTQYTIRPVLDNTIYNIRVRAVSRGLQSLWKAISFDSTEDDSIPSAPANLTVTGSYGSAKLSWDAVTTNTDASAANDIFLYAIYRGTSSNPTTLIDTTAGAGWSDVGLADGTTYHYRVRAVDFSGNLSGYSNNASTSTKTSASVGQSSYTGRVYFQTLQGSAPSTPSASSYNAATGQFTGLTSGWAVTQPSVSVTNTSVQEWSSVYTVKIDNSTGTQTITFATPTGAIQVTADIESDNFSLTLGAEAGWKIERDTGNAWFNDVTLRGDLVAGEVNIQDGNRYVSITPEGTGLILDAGTDTNSDVVRFLKTGGFGDVVSIVQQVGNGDGLFIDKQGGGSGDALLIETNGGSGSTGADIRNLNAGGGEAQIALSSANGGYAYFAVDGDYLVNTGHSYLPFTGTHFGVMDKSIVPTSGDIVVDSEPLTVSVSDSICKSVLSSTLNQKGAVGVFTEEVVWHSNTALGDDYELYETNYNLIKFNGVGEGAINVCGENGNISKGDLIVTSSMPGKGMKQSDDIVRSYTVAKAREDVTFSSPTEVKMVACIYLCG